MMYILYCGCESLNYVYIFCFFLQTGHDGLLIDPDGKSFMGKLGSELKLCGKVGRGCCCMHARTHTCTHTHCTLVHTHRHARIHELIHRNQSTCN